MVVFVGSVGFEFRGKRPDFRGLSQEARTRRT
jgi:hypothetical protein